MARTSNTTRIATVKANNRKYIVQRMYIPRNPAEQAKVFCWGEVQSYKGLRTRHKASKTFLRSAVEVQEVTVTPALIEELFQQNITVLKEQGHVVTNRGRNYTDHGTEEQIARRREADAALRHTLGSIGLIGDIIRSTSTPEIGGFPGKVQDGGSKPIPEEREHILTKIIDRLTAPGAPEAIRQDYSNGEFTTSSLIVGTTFAAVASRRQDLEVAGNVAYYDTDLDIWWRRGGSFD